MNKHKIRLLALLGAGACLVSSCNLASETSTTTDAELLARANAANNSVTATNTGSTTPKTSTTTTTSTNPKTSSTTSTAPKTNAVAPAPVVNTSTALRSSGGVLTVPAAINSRMLRAQVIHTRNGYHPAFDVSGTKGSGIANGFQWINFGKNSSGVYNAGKPLSQFPSGKLGGALWLISLGKANAGAFGSNRDGDIVVSE